MKSNRKLAGIFGLLMMAIFAGQSTGLTVDVEGRTTADTPKFALLVGVNDYAPTSGIRNLSGTHNDVMLMKSLLLEKGFKEELVTTKTPLQAPCGAQKETSGIKTLCSAQATKSAILAAFDSQLIENAKAYWKGGVPDPIKGPLVVFYYSGHGSQVPDDEPIAGETKADLMIDEADGLDETIVPFDTNRAGSRDIRDDSFKTRIDELKAFTSNIVFISDSCHSGTISRGPGSRNIVRKFPNLKAPSGKGEERDMAADNSYVTISGSMTDQLSYEDDLPDPVTRKVRTNGFLTYFFVQNVRNYPGATYQEIISLVRSSVAAAGKVQTPQAEGDVNRPVFDVAGSAGKRAIALKCTEPDGKPVCSTEVKSAGASPAGATKIYEVSLDAGEIVGARVGGPIDVYARDNAGKDAVVASGTIISADAFSSEAEVVFTDPKATDIPPISKAILLSPNFSDKKRPIAIDLKGSGASDAGVASMKKLSENLKANQFFAASEGTDILKSLGVRNKAWQLAVIRGSYADFKVGADKRLAAKDSAAPPDDQQGYFISDQAGIPLYDLWFRADDAGAPGKIQTALESYAKAENVRALRNEGSAINDQIKVEQVRYKTVTIAGKKCTAVPYSDAEKANLVAGTPQIKRSEAFDIKITNLSSKTLYLYVYSIDSTGAIGLLFPAPGANEMLPENASYLTSQGDPCSMLNFAPTAPTGFETIKVLVSETPIMAEALTQPGASRGKGVDGFLETLLRTAGSNSRGPTRVRDVKDEDWAAFNLEYSVIP